MCVRCACGTHSLPAALLHPVVTALHVGLTSLEPVELKGEVAVAYLSDRLGWSVSLSDVPLDARHRCAEEFWLDCIGSGGGDRRGGGLGVDKLPEQSSSDRALSLNRTVLELGTGL